MTTLTPGEHLIVLLGEGGTLAQAAKQARMTNQEAYAEAQSYGWPDRRQIRQAAAEIVTRQRASTAQTSTDPGEPMPRRNPPPRRSARTVPLEPEVVEALAPAAIRSNGDGHADDAAHDAIIGALIGPVLGDEGTRGGRDDERKRQPQPAAEATAPGAGSTQIPDDLDRVVDRQDELEHAAEQRRIVATVRGIDAALMEDTAAVLRIIDRSTPAPTDRATLALPLGRLITPDGVETVLGEAVVDVHLDRDGVLRALADGGNGIVERGLRATVRRRLTPDGADAIRALVLLLEDGAQ